VLEKRRCSSFLREEALLLFYLRCNEKRGSSLKREKGLLWDPGLLQRRGSFQRRGLVRRGNNVWEKRSSKPCSPLLSDRVRLFSQFLVS
jgi:hypothetical protein